MLKTLPSAGISLYVKTIQDVEEYLAKTQYNADSITVLEGLKRSETSEVYI